MSRNGLVLSGIFLFLALCLSGCGGSAPAVSVAVTATASSVDGNDTTTLTATVTHDHNAAGVTWSVSGGGNLSNTTTTSATYTAPSATSSSQTATITVTSIADTAKTGTLSITIPAAPSVTSTSASLAGAVGSTYSVTLSASGGISPYTWALGSGTTLPACLTLKSTGVLTTTSGTAPTAACAGTYSNITFKVTDSGTPTPLTQTSSALTITITAPSITFTPALPNGNVGVAYAGSVAATGVLGSTAYSLASGALPPDLSLNAATGAIVGTPKAADVGTASFKVSVTDAYGDTATSGTLSITIAAAPAFTFSTPAATGTFGVAYAGSAAATGGAGALAYSVASGALPPDLLLNAATGAITGTPKAADIGTFTFAVKAADAFGDSATSTTFTIVVTYPAVNVTTSSLPTGYVSGTYTASALAATGGNGGPYTWTWAAAGGSTLPAGLSLSTAGVITGSPTTPGTYSVVVTATDSASNTGNTTLSITVKPGISINAITLPTGYAGSAYPPSGTSATFGATGGNSGPYTWTWVAAGGSSIPAGLALSSAGTISGTPTAAGSYSVVVTATDAAQNTANVTLPITIDAGVTITTPTTLPSGSAGTAYSQALAATGGASSGYTWTVTAGATGANSLATVGLTLSSGGTLSATTPTAGTATFTAKVTDSAGNTNSALFTVTIEAAIAITTASPLKSGTINASYSVTLAASGGSGTYTWTTTGTNNLAAFGLSLSSAGVLSSSNLGVSTGTVSFTAQVTDTQSHSTTAAFTFSVSNALTISSPATLPAGDAGSAYSYTLAAAGGTGSGYSWSATGGNFATSGLSLNTSTGAITGTPTASGTITFTATVTDSGSNQTTQTESIPINGALSLPSPNPSSLPSGYVGVSYTGSVTGSGGSGNLSLTVTAGPTPADGLTATPTGATVNLSGTPASNATVSITFKLTDNTVSNSINQTYTIPVTTPTTPSLPTPTTTVPGAATVGTGYTGSISASGGVGPTYTWTVNSTTVPTTGSLALSDGLSVSTSGGSSLSITGTPTSVSTSPGVQFTASVKDNTTGLTSSTQTYTVVVYAAGQNIGGQIILNNNCGNSGSQPTFTVNINYPSAGSPTTVTTDSSGNYSFNSIPNGTYAITPSIPAATSSLFYPASSSVTVNNATISGENFNAEVGYTVSGNVTYSGSQTGQTYVVLNGTTCGNGNSGLGTSITESTLTSGGAFSIRGVPPGGYSLQAWMDPIGQSASNAIDPTGSTSVTVTSATVTNAAVTMTNPTFATPSSNPSLQAIASAGGAVIFYQASSVHVNGNKVEDANQYTVQWSTSPTLTGAGGPFASISGSKTFKAIGTGGTTLWILNNTTDGANTFTSGTTYYFQARSINTLAGSQSPSGWSTYSSGGNPAGVTIGAATCSSGCTTVSGAITIPSGVNIASGAPLYVGFYQQTASDNGPSAIYAAEITSPVAGGSGNSYSISIPSGSGYYLFGILDQNIDGQVDAGDVQNTNGNNSNGITVSGSTMTGQNTTLPGANSTVSVTTQYQSSTSSGGSSTSYGINLDLREANKLPVAVTLTSGPNFINPIDMAACNTCGDLQFQYSTSIPGGTSAVGDTYDFTVTYSDGTQDTGSTVNGKVTAWDSANGGASVVGSADLATNLSPTGTSSTSTTPTFTWTFPANPSDFTYSFYISPSSCSGSCSNIWQIPGNNSNVNGFTYAETGSGTTGTLTWGTDPIPGDSSTPTGPLTVGDMYNWSIQIQDSNGNQAQTNTWYQP